MKQLTTWTDNKEEFQSMLKDGIYTITKDLKLYYETEVDYGDLNIDSDDIECEIIIGNNSFDTFRLRQYCSEFHPEIEFDEEFITDEPGVFERYHKKFGHDYEEWATDQTFNELENKLKDKDYVLSFKS